MKRRTGKKTEFDSFVKGLPSGGSFFKPFVKAEKAFSAQEIHGVRNKA